MKVFGLNKQFMKKCFSDNGIPTSEWIVTDNQTDAINFAKETRVVGKIKIIPG